MKKSKAICTVLMLVVFAFNTVNSQNNFHNRHILDPYNPEYVEGEILVKFKDEVKIDIQQRDNQISTGLRSIDDFLVKYEATTLTKVFKSREKKETRYINTYKGERTEVPQLFNIYKLKLNSTQDAKELAELLSEDPLVDFAEPNYLVYTMDTFPDDPYYTGGNQWYIDTVNAPAAWDSTTCDTTQIIGIIDTGVDWDHPDLDNNIWTNWNEIPGNGIDDDGNGYIDDIRGWDFVNDDNNPNDDNSHGTHVAGIAAAETNNGVGIAGIAWNAKIMPVKMLQSSGSGSSSDLASAIEYASDNGATVINMSLGSYGESLTVKTALENAYADTGTGGGSILVAAAGNNGYKVDPPFPPFPIYKPMYPACYSFIIGVEASTSSGARAGFSNMDLTGPVFYTNSWGHNYEIMAPGEGIISCKPNGNYWQKSGTSMASPIVAGAVALMRQYQPTQSGEQIFAKLIQGANSGVLDIYNSLIIDLVPDLYYVDYTIVDTLPGCDGDGVADAGETIELYLTVKNAGGFADSVWSKFRFGEFEDTTVANIIDSTSYIGDISAYATMTGELNPFIIKIDSNVANNRDIVFEYEIGAENHSSFTGELIITVQNGVEISGVMIGSTSLYPDKFYIITNHLAILADDTLTIYPGTIININDDVNIIIGGHLIAHGTPDSLITFTNNNNGWGKFDIQGNADFEYCIIEGSTNGDRLMRNDGSGLSLKNSIVRYNNCSGFLNYFNLNIIEYCNFVENVFQGSFSGSSVGPLTNGENFNYNNVINNRNYYGNWYGGMMVTCGDFIAENNNIFTNIDWPSQTERDLSVFVSELEMIDISPNYWGTADSLKIGPKIIDFYENGSGGIADYSGFLLAPSNLSHGVVWKVLVNEIDPQDEYLDPVGSETVKFDVYFNRPMDTVYAPLLTFGVREPYTQHIVADSASWSADSTVWTAYHSVGLETGDGIQTVRVANAKDDEHFEIPIEDSRFEFVIQAAGAQSIDFIATAGIGKVDLEWPAANTPDILGYNLYRFYNLTDTTYSDTTLINSELILDTLYTDFNVIPDTTYHYLYKIVGTDMQESDFSKVVSATPFSAANGDANGDLLVNVLDITTIVSYMLNQNPTPFLFDAADVNYDGDINVLDIIGLVQLISGNKSMPLTEFIDVSKKVAYYDIADNILWFESEGNVAALQFKIQNSNLQRATRNPQQLEKLKIFSLQQGFEFAYGIVDDHIIGILFSLTGKEIPTGDQELFRFEGVDISEIEVTEIFGGDLNGDYVTVLKKGQQSSMKLPEGYELTVQPNPFTHSTIISWQLAEEALVDISIYDLNSRKIRQIKNSDQQAGFHQAIWDGRNDAGNQLAPGIYICHMEVKTKDNKITKYVKIILMK